jgi:hypothetical protein
MRGRTSFVSHVELGCRKRSLARRPGLVASPVAGGIMVIETAVFRNALCDFGHSLGKAAGTLLRRVLIASQQLANVPRHFEVLARSDHQRADARAGCADVGIAGCVPIQGRIDVQPQET